MLVCAEVVYRQLSANCRVKVEIIPFVDEPAAFVVNALAPAEVAKVVMDEVAGRMEVVVPDDQLSLAYRSPWSECSIGVAIIGLVHRRSN